MTAFGSPYTATTSSFRTRTPSDAIAPHSQLAATGHPELSNEQHIKPNIERARHFMCYWNATAVVRDDHITAGALICSSCGANIFPACRRPW
jgi:hypothetical protein